MPSWVHVDASGGITGFIGVIPRPFALGGETVTTAMTTKFMVAPDARPSKAAMLLFRKFIDGPQQVSFADITNHHSVLFWQAFGGLTVPICSMEWRRSLKRCPSKRWTPRAGLLGSLTNLCRPWIDQTAQRLLPTAELRDPEVVETEFDCAEVAAALPNFCGPDVVCPQYDADSLGFVLRMLSEAPDSELMHALVRDQDGTLIGGFVYLIDDESQTAQVVQIAANKNKRERVLDALLRHAERRGATDVVGRLDATWLPLLAARRDITCNFRGFSLMIRAKHVELSERILRGDIHITPLEGELLTQFHHER